ncbi:hypothetical protein ACHAXS_003969 [Conticribra weissflogii]
MYFGQNDPRTWQWRKPSLLNKTSLVFSSALFVNPTSTRPKPESAVLEVGYVTPPETTDTIKRTPTIPSRRSVVFDLEVVPQTATVLSGFNLLTKNKRASTISRSVVDDVEYANQPSSSPSRGHETANHPCNREVMNISTRTVTQLPILPARGSVVVDVEYAPQPPAVPPELNKNKKRGFVPPAPSHIREHENASYFFDAEVPRMDKRAKSLASAVSDVEYAPESLSKVPANRSVVFDVEYGDHSPDLDWRGEHDDSSPSQWDMGNDSRSPPDLPCKKIARTHPAVAIPEATPARRRKSKK